MPGLVVSGGFWLGGLWRGGFFMSGFLDSWLESENICKLGMFWEDFVWEHRAKPCAPEVA